MNKVSELIHKSANNPNPEYAKVQVFFQLIHDIEEDDDAYEVVPNSEFVVTRVAFQNNSSKYTVDGKNSTYTEVGQLLRHYGIDLDNNRFLILQGEVEQIAMMKPKAATPHEEGLLEYLEDIIGSNKYVERIEEIGKNLEGMNEQRVEKVNRLKIAEKERDNLSDSKGDAEAFIEKEKEIRRRKNILYQIYESINLANAEDFNQRKQQAEEKLNHEKSKLSSTESKLAEINKVYEQTRADHDAVESELKKTELEFGAFERRDVKLTEDMKHCKAKVKKLKADVEKDTKKAEECTKDADASISQIDAARKTLTETESRKAEEEAKLDEIMKGLRDATESLRGDLEEAQVKLADAERGISSLQTEKETVSTSMQLLNDRAENAAKTIQTSEDKKKKIIVDRTATQEKISALKKESADKQSKVTQLQKEIDTREKEEIDLQKKLRVAVSNAEEAKSALSMGSGNRNAVVTAIMKAAKKGGPLESAGIRGRLGDLGTIPAEYDVAISTACSSLDNIVVNTVVGAEACMKFLREYNIGRGSFLPLERVEQCKAQMEKGFNAPQGSQRLFDLVTPQSDDLKVAFYYTLRDTLVVKDQATANKVAFGGEGGRPMFKVVTVEGSMIETSGTMAGGGAPKSGSMMLQRGSSSGPRPVVATGEEVTAVQVQNLEASVTKLQKLVAECRDAKLEATKLFEEYTSRLSSISTEIEKLQMALTRFEEQESDLSKKIASLQSETQLTKAEKDELASLSLRLSSIEKEIQKVSPNFNSLKTNVALIQQRILDVGGPKLARAQATVEALTTKFDTLSSKLSTLVVEETNYRKQAEKAILAKNKNEEEMNKLDEKLKALMKEHKEMEADALQVMQAVEAARERMAQQEAQSQAITKEYNDIKASMAKIKSVELDLIAEIEKIAKELKDNLDQAHKWRKEIDHLQKIHLEEQKEFNGSVKLAMAAAAALMGTATVPSEEKMDVEEDDSTLESLQVLRPDQLAVARHDVDEIKREINGLESEVEKMKKDVNMSALIEYMKKDAQYKIRLVELETITNARNLVRKEYEDLRRQRLEEFMAGFGIITLKLKEMYQMITLGGDAELELVDSLDPFSEGIVFSVRPPKKSWKNITNLSGGEKTLSSLALVFALHHFKPTPLYVMDEIDAALDFKNVSIVANYIKERTKNAQFVIISLRNNMFELADRLVGIYKTNDATKSVTINPKTFAANNNIDNTSKSNTLKTSSKTITTKPQKSILADASNKVSL